MPKIDCLLQHISGLWFFLNFKLNKFKNSNQNKNDWIMYRNNLNAEQYKITHKITIQIIKTRWTWNIYRNNEYLMRYRKTRENIKVENKINWRRTKIISATMQSMALDSAWIFHTYNLHVWLCYNSKIYIVKKST